MVTAKAICYGAATIINAIATGKGAALGIKLWTKAEVKITDEPGIITGEIISDPTEKPILIEKIVERLLKYFKLWEKNGAKVKTWSNIPIARGLKSSSVAANAIVLATSAALNKKLEDLKAINLGVDGALKAEVTITGAFDDASAAYFGGIVITDNIQRKIIKRFVPPKDLQIMFFVPSNKAYTKDVDVNSIKNVADLVKISYNEALKGNFWSALTLNGLIHSSVLGYDTSIALEALKAGALASGLCGKGPTVTVVIKKDRIDSIKDVLESYEGKIIETKINLEKAMVIN